MLFQLESLMFIIWLVLATIIVTLVIYIAVRVIESEHKASDKKFMILLLAFIAVLILPIVVGAIGMVLGAIGGLLGGLRSLIDGGGANYLTNLVPIIFFLLLLLLTKYLVDITWESSLWISLLTLFILYVIYSLIPELYTFVQFG
ncbi:MAG: hypothetical protein ACTSRI_10750 [Promethearchaeota archaeon]